jgi:FtsZ-binding cell division protein ZapB
MTDTAKEVAEGLRALYESVMRTTMPDHIRHERLEALKAAIEYITALQSSFEKARADVVRLEWEVADKQARIEALEKAGFRVIGSFGHGRKKAIETLTSLLKQAAPQESP